MLIFLTRPTTWLGLMARRYGTTTVFFLVIFFFVVPFFDTYAIWFAVAAAKLNGRRFFHSKGNDHTRCRRRHYHHNSHNGNAALSHTTSKNLPKIVYHTSTALYHRTPCARVPREKAPAVFTRQQPQDGFASLLYLRHVHPVDLRARVLARHL